MEYTDIKTHDDLLRFIATQDFIGVSTSGGKDSQVTLDVMHHNCVEAERFNTDSSRPLVDRIVAIHADLGEVEWTGTKELAQAQAEHYGVRFIVCSRIGGVAAKSGKTYQKGEVFGSILDYWQHRGAGPSDANRWCTSEFKRGPILKVLTALAAELNLDRPARILDCMGIRAKESPARAKKPVWHVRKSTRNQHVTSYLPIHDWTVGQVWLRIHESGAPYHRAYGLGMGRLSCQFCIYAPRNEALIAGHDNPELLQKYVSVERLTGHKFKGNPAKVRKGDYYLADVLKDVKAGVEPVRGDNAKGTDSDDGCWNM
jgi:3'-phosphoadenosine 5'-phosphosulfate sulfotransferase (PAPS reductase)/FAD synthetase